MTATTPTPASTLGVLTQQRILDLARVFGVRLRSTSTTKTQLAQLVGAQLEGRLPAVLRELGREELAATCEAHGVASESTARRELIATLLVSAGIDPAHSVAPAPVQNQDGLPRSGQIVRARHQRELLPPGTRAEHRVRRAPGSADLRAPPCTAVDGADRRRVGQGEQKLIAVASSARTARCRNGFDPRIRGLRRVRRLLALRPPGAAWKAKPVASMEPRH
jgi:hypothetical protein